jgi:hypothetical protein
MSAGCTCRPTRCPDVSVPVQLGAPPDLSWSHRHGKPLRLSRAGCSRQFGRASAPTIPHRVQTIRGPNVGTGTSSDHGSALKIARWWHCRHDTSSDRTPLLRMLRSVIGWIGSLKRVAAMRVAYDACHPSGNRAQPPGGKPADASCGQAPLGRHDAHATGPRPPFRLGGAKLFLAWGSPQRWAR